jgi:hypothetical protein
MRRADRVVNVKATDGMITPGSVRVDHDQLEGSSISSHEAARRFSLSSSSLVHGHRMIGPARGSVLEGWVRQQSGAGINMGTPASPMRVVKAYAAHVTNLIPTYVGRSQKQ